MRLLTAIVESQYDPNDPTALICRLIGSEFKNLQGVPVLMVSPFSTSMTGAGMTAYPQRGDMVLIAQADNDTSFFYMGTVSGLKRQDLRNGLFNYPSDKELMELDPFKRTISIRDNKDGILTFTDKANDVSMRSFVKLSSGTTSMTMNRQPGMEAYHVRLSNGETYHKMDGPGNLMSNEGPGSSKLQAEFNNTVNTQRGTIKIKAQSLAREIKITNYGIFAPASPLFGVKVPDIKNGDIDIESWHNTINLRTYGGSLLSNPIRTGVFIGAGITTIGTPDPVAAPKACIQLNSAGIVQVFAGVQGIDLNSLGPINMKSASMINMQAPMINLNPPIPPVVVPVIPNINAQAIAAQGAGAGLA